MFGQQAQQQGQAQPTQLYQQVTALSAPTLLGDERDSILAKWNQLQAYWGTGKGYHSNNNPPVDFTLENPFCRFKVTVDSSVQWLEVLVGSFDFEYETAVVCVFLVFPRRWDIAASQLVRMRMV